MNVTATSPKQTELLPYINIRWYSHSNVKSVKSVQTTEVQGLAVKRLQIKSFEYKAVLKWLNLNRWNLNFSKVQMKCGTTFYNQQNGERAKCKTGSSVKAGSARAQRWIHTSTVHDSTVDALCFTSNAFQQQRCLFNLCDFSYSCT